jgi:DNA-binding Lrp family transcriptional regulator
MDEIDRKLLRTLQEDATLSVAQLADRVGLSPTPCWKRVQKLEAQGVIARRVAIVDPASIGVALSVFVARAARARPRCCGSSPDWSPQTAAPLPSTAGRWTGSAPSG